jgi:hypothetical protein
LSLRRASPLARHVDVGVRAEPRARDRAVHQPGLLVLSAADKLAGELARDPSLVVMSSPIDYWDYLGWKDTLALPATPTGRRAYSKARGDREVYTPQVVVNGACMCSAATRTRSRTRSRRRASRRHAVAAGQLSVAASRFRCRCRPPKRCRDQGRGLALPDHQQLPSRDRRGENSGTRSRITTWCGAGSSSAMDRRGAHLHGAEQEIDRVGGDAVAVVVQSGSKEAPGTMLGATVAALQ